MIQEIITFIIITIAVVIAVRKTVKKFRKRKRSSANANHENESITRLHNCSDCAAECMLRDSISPGQRTEEALCKKINVNSD